MHYSSLEYLRCVSCNSKINLDSYIQDGQIREGILSCVECGLKYPIIDGVPILWNDFVAYLSNRPRLGGELLLMTKSAQLKSFIKSTLAKSKKTLTDLSIVEKRWATIYQSNQRSKFYFTAKKLLKASAGLSLEHGCSIGTMTAHLAKNSRQAFGIDKSFYAIRQAKKSHRENLDFFVADSLEHPFGKTKFDLVLGLNLFELIEPKKLVNLLAGQVKKNGTLVLSDPYDYERGVHSVKEPLYEDSLRKEIVKLGFVISAKTKKPGHIKWNLFLHKRAVLQYLVDLVVAKKS